MAKASSRSKGRPNVIIFMMDTQGARNMSCYGYRKPTTPNIDRIAKEGALFLNHFVTAPWTLPVHASLFTGRYESGHGAGAQHEGLEPGLPQMPEVFGKNGYRTVAFCNNHWALDESRVSAGTGWDEIVRYGFEKYKPVAPYIPPEDPDLRDKGALKAVGLMSKWLDDNAVGKQKPFFLFVNCTEPHDPYNPPEPFRSRFMPEGMEYEPLFKNKGGQCKSTIGDRCQTFDEWLFERCMYDALTACLDDRIGMFVEELKRRELYDDTIFIVTGDHGDVQGEQVGYSYHSQNGVWDHVCKTPLVVRYPRVFKAGTKCREMVQINDVFPTLMDICGIKDKDAAESIQGENLLAALKKPVRDFALLEAQRAIHPMRRAWGEGELGPDLDVRFMNVSYKAARTKRYKYVWVSNGRDMLFDTVKDPDERWNIIDRKPQVATKLRKAMEAKLMGIEQRYFMDWKKQHNPRKQELHTLRRLAAWGLYQPGIVAPWGEQEEKCQKQEG